MPQGGVDEGESYLSAMRRRTFEETSIKNIKILKEIAVLNMNFKELIGIIWKGDLEVKNKNGLLRNLLVKTMK